MAYLIFTSPEEAEERSAEAAKKKGLAFWKYGSGTKYVWGWVTENAEEDPRAYIEIKKNTWTDEESGEEHVSIPDQNLLTEDDELVDDLPEDWVYPSAPFINEEDDSEDPPLAD